MHKRVRIHREEMPHLPRAKLECTIYKPDASVKAPTIHCAFCTSQGKIWCMKCFAPLCLKHVWPPLSPFPHTRVALYEGDQAWCRQHAPAPMPFEPRGYVDD
jgi:hypothetical protein